MNLQLKIPPPIVGLISAVVMWLLGKLFDTLNFDFPYKNYMAIAVLLVAIIIDILALIKFKNAQTTINPIKPEQSSELVKTGIYQYTRNPMYLGLLLILCCWALFISYYSSIIMLPVFVWYITFFQIIPEEAVMEEKFGDIYIKYKQSVRRWI